MALELVGEVGLVVEADLGRDPRDRLAVEQALRAASMRRASTYWWGAILKVWVKLPDQMGWRGADGQPGLG